MQTSPSFSTLRNTIPTARPRFHHALKPFIISCALMVIGTSAIAGTYRVKAGDTLQSIANQYDTTVSNLININNLKDKNDIKVGDRISTTDVSAISYRGSTMSYTVQYGDTISSIAKRFNTKVSTLAELNQSKVTDTATQLYVGDKLVVPTPMAQTAQNSQTTSSPKNTVNTVTVAKVVEKPAIINNDALKTTITTTVKNSIATQNYKVKAGDTLFGIANRYGVDKKKLMELNDFNVDTKVNVGQTVLLPASAKLITITDKPKSTIEKVTTTVKSTTVKTTPKTEVKDKTDNTVDFSEYVVKSGDSLSVIANRYQTTVSGLTKINQLTSNSALKPGQKLVVPVHK